MNLKLVTIPQNLLKFWFFRKNSNWTTIFSIFSTYFPVLGRLKLDLLCHQTLAITSLYPCLLMQSSFRWKDMLFFPGIPFSFRAQCASMLCNELFSYLAPPHCFSWFSALFTSCALTCLFCSEDKAINLLVAFYFTVCMLLRYTLNLFLLCSWCVRGMIIIQTVSVEKQGTGTWRSRFSISSELPASSV